MQKSLLRALLMPQARLKAVEAVGDYIARLVLTEELRDLPFAAVWEGVCSRTDLPVGSALLEGLEAYQSGVAGRG
jgi:L-rhamnose isomerase